MNIWPVTAMVSGQSRQGGNFTLRQLCMRPEKYLVNTNEFPRIIRS